MTVPQQTLLLPTSSDKLIASDGKAEIMMQTWMRVIQGRTGGTNGVNASSGQQLAATGTTQATALVLTDDFAFISTVPSNSGVQLFALQEAQQQWVFNIGLLPLKIYPTVGGQIDALGLNAPYSLAKNKAQVFTCEIVPQI